MQVDYYSMDSKGLMFTRQHGVETKPTRLASNLPRKIHGRKEGKRRQEEAWPFLQETTLSFN